MKTETLEPSAHAAIDLLQHDLHQYFPALAALGTTPALLASPLYAQLKPEITRILDTVAQENYAPAPATLRVGPSV